MSALLCLTKWAALSRSALVGAGLAMCAIAPASAQIGVGGGPIQIEADTLEVVDSKRQAVYAGNVDAIQGQTRVRADRLTIVFAARAGDQAGAGVGGRFGEIRELIADGDVYYITPAEKARGDRGQYDYLTDTLVLTGDVVITRNDNIISGDRLVIEVATGRSTITAKEPEEGDRIVTVINPQGGPAPN